MRYCKKLVGLSLIPNKDLATVTQADIIENPKHLKFTEMKSLTIPSVRTDFDYIVITGAIIYNAKLILNLHWQMKMYYHNGYYKS